MKIKADTIARTIVLLLALINQVLAVLGKDVLPFADETIYELVTLIFTIGASAWAWWKNNSITNKAIVADKYLAELKKEDTKND